MMDEYIRLNIIQAMQPQTTALTQLGGEFGKFTIGNKLKVHSKNTFYLVTRSTDEGPNREKFVMKIHPNSAHYTRQHQVYEEVYSQDEELSDFYVAKGEHQMSFYTVCRYQPTESLFNFLQYIIKMPQICCQYYMFRMLQCLCKVKNKLKYLHYNFHLENLLVSLTKKPIVIGWGTSQPEKTERQIVFQCASVFAQMLTGKPPAKIQANKSKYLNEKQWNLYVKKPALKDVSPDSLNFLKAALVESEGQTLQSLEALCSHPYMAGLQADPTEIRSQIVELEQERLRKQEQRISNDFKKKASHEKMIRESEEECLNTRGLSDHIVRNYNCFSDKIKNGSEGRLSEQEGEIEESSPKIRKNKSYGINQVDQRSFAVTNLYIALMEWKNNGDFLGEFVLLKSSVEWESITSHEIELRVTLFLVDKDLEPEYRKAEDIDLEIKLITGENPHKVEEIEIAIVGQSPLHPFYDTKIINAIRREFLCSATLT